MVRKTLNFLSKFMRELVGDHEIHLDLEVEKDFTEKEKNAIVQKDLIPRWPSHKKSDFAKNIEAVISSSNIQKRKQGILNKAVSDFEKDPLNLSLEISSRKGIVRLAQILDYSFWKT